MSGKNFTIRRFVSAGVGSLCAWLAAATAVHAAPSNGAMRSMGNAWQHADARDYRHCHYMGRRAYCHVSDRLPRNWPPHIDMPSERKPEPEKKIGMPTYLR